MCLFNVLLGERSSYIDLIFPVLVAEKDSPTEIRNLDFLHTATLD
jgi:hypothetical protein